MKITDALLRQHAAEARDLWLGTLPPDASHTFSHRFRRKMKRLLAEQRRSPAMNRAVLIARRTAAALLVAASLTAASLLSVEAYREKFIEVVTEFFDDLTEFRFSGFADDGAPMPEVTLTYVPEGMELYESDDSSELGSRYRAYKDANGRFFDLEEIFITKDMVGVQALDTENAQICYGSIRGNSAMIVQKNGWITLHWEEKNMIMQLSGNLSMDEMTRIAEGIQKTTKK